MGIGFERDLPYTLHEFRETRITGRIDPQDKSIHETADQILRLHARAIGNGSPYQLILLIAVARQQHRIRRYEDHKQCGPTVATEPPEAFGEFPTQLE